MLVKSNRRKKFSTLKAKLKRRQPMGVTQGGSSSRWRGAKVGARDGEKKG